MNDATWSLHPRLAADTVPVGDFVLSRLLLSNDAHYPWLILVPRRADIREIHELSEADQQQLLRESMLLSRALMTAFSPTKLNIAALGNMVPQLHVHHIARYDNDAAWPAPVWGRVPAIDYEAAVRSERIRTLRELLGGALHTAD
ncbi:HIT domain-containing protein [Nevskia sp.]|uniref:HIT domain-containing protein n=1 Tax=Nevskia sp. TaxID=1929292 RepID=UPI0025D882C0|nr:HIT domain-containing protein [Nevskia sp.]